MILRRWNIRSWLNLVKSKSNNWLLSMMKRDHSPILGSLDEKVKSFLMILRKKGGIVNSDVAITVAQALIEKSTDKHLKSIDLISSTRTQSLFQRIGFFKRMRTTDKPESLIKLRWKLSCSFNIKLLVWSRNIRSRHQSLWTLIRLL